MANSTEILAAMAKAVEKLKDIPANAELTKLIGDAVKNLNKPR